MEGELLKATVFFYKPAAELALDVVVMGPKRNEKFLGHANWETGKTGAVGLR